MAPRRIHIVKTPVEKLQKKILRILRDDYLHSIEDLAGETGAGRTDVKAALEELQQCGKVYTRLRRWASYSD